MRKKHDHSFCFRFVARTTSGGFKDWAAEVAVAAAKGGSDAGSRIADAHTVLCCEDTEVYVMKALRRQRSQQLLQNVDLAGA